MNKHLEQLVKLSKFDKEIVGFEPQIKGQNDKLKVFLKTVDELNEKINKLCVEIDDAKNKRIKNDIHLKDLNERIKEINTKYDSIKNEKEAKSLQLEEEIAKEQIAFANNEIARLDEISSSKEKISEELKRELAQEEADVEELRSAISKNIEELEVKREVVYKEKSELVEQIDVKILSFYEKIKRWAGNSAVVPIKNQACYGCHMKLTNRAYSDFLTTEEIFTCPHCGRIIYKETAIEE
ncbi:MAG: C4-type zinc ribbon domain-containing protein [Epsilonproteobacteria bacterium]|nr:C4-type zinc ribbon domain-containing protein [Campylobacterota bacterium]